MRPPWADALAAALGDCPVETDADILAAHARDQAPLAPAGVASALVRARRVEHVATTLRFANERGIPVVPRAAATGLAGGANAIDGCIVLGVSALDRILSIDPVTRFAVVEPGVLNGTLVREVAPFGLTYAPDPASRDISTIGGNIATNAGGPCCMKYGVTGDHVAALTVLLPDGTQIKTGGRTRKNVAGLDLTGLFVGSEGVLGVVVEATVRLIPTPRPPSTLLAFFPTLDAAGDAIVQLAGRGDLARLELMDQVTLTAVDALTQMGLDTTAAACLIAQCDAVDAAAVIGACASVCEGYGAAVMATDDPDEGRMLMGARTQALPALEKRGTTLLDDVAVPIAALPEMIRRIQRTASRHGTLIGTFGHAGDGNLHPTLVFDAASAEATTAANAAFGDIMRDAVALGGTISGEHGIGSLKPGYLSGMFSDAERALMRRVKAAFDPKGILNPGKAI